MVATSVIYDVISSFVEIFLIWQGANKNYDKENETKNYL